MCTVTVERVAQILRDLVAIPSINPDLEFVLPEHSGEAKIADFLSRAFVALGGKVEVDEVLPGRPNLYVTFERPGATSWRAVDVHTDTVGINGMTMDPFQGKSCSERVYGRGAVDTKATIAVLLAVLEAAAASKKGTVTTADNLLIALTVGEENGGAGATRFAQWVRERGIEISQLIVAEPTDLAPVFAHNARLVLDLEITGRAAHVTNPHLGINAVTVGGQLVSTLFAESERLLSESCRGVTGSPILQVVGIQGGEFDNTIPAKCRLGLDRRVVPGESPESVLRELIALAEETVQRAGAVLKVLKQRYGRPLFTDSSSGLVKELSELSGQSPKVAAYGTNAAYYSPLPAREVVVFGPGSIAQAHAADEFILKEQLQLAAEIYWRWLRF